MAYHSCPVLISCPKDKITVLMVLVSLSNLNVKLQNVKMIYSNVGMDHANKTELIVLLELYVLG
jgi:hypothetical protein